MPYTLYNATGINYTLQGEDEIYTLNKNFVVNPKADFWSTKTALRTFNNLMTKPVDKILLTRQVNINADLDQYNIVSYDPNPTTISASEPIASGGINLHVTFNTKNFYGITPSISGEKAGLKNHYLIESYSDYNQPENTYYFYIKKLSIPTSTYRGELPFLLITAYYPEGSKEYKIPAILTD